MCPWEPGSKCLKTYFSTVRATYYILTRCCYSMSDVCNLTRSRCENFHASDMVDTL